MRDKTTVLLIGGVILFLLMTMGNPFFIVNEYEQVIVTQFGKPVGPLFHMRPFVAGFQLATHRGPVVPVVVPNVELGVALAVHVFGRP